MSISLFAVKLKVRLNRGQSWVDFIKNFVYVLLGLRLILDAVKEFGYSIKEFAFLYFVLPILYLFAIYILGYLDEKYGIWKQEAVYGSKNLNPWNQELMNKIDIIISEIKK